MTTGELRKRVLQEAPALAADIEKLVATWVSDLSKRLQSDRPPEFRPKQVNDPIWGTIELLPWEVALLDSQLLQRMRGVRQLGLAQLVFPGACHGRLEHIIGVVGATEASLQALSRQIERWNRDHKQQQIAQIEPKERHAIRLAALLHDIGHGPFSHALEPVLEVEAPLDVANASAEGGWRKELRNCAALLKTEYSLDQPPVISEVLAVLMVLSDAMQGLFASDRLMTERVYTADELQETVVAAIIGAVDGHGATYLSGLISSQIDADKLDYLARDAHHAGLEIGFDTSRLLARLEVLRIKQENLDNAADDLRARVAATSDGVLLQLGIAASGFGSFEQMLIGRTFLYDRLYHHHKVRAAEAMAQRLMLIAERDRGERFGLEEIFISVDDDTMLRLFAEEISHPRLATKSKAAAALAKGVVERRLLHRAFAFRGRFIATVPGLDEDATEKNRRNIWQQIVKDLDGLKARFELGREIFDVAQRCCDALISADVNAGEASRLKACLDEVGAEQIIVDLPGKKAAAIRILARYPNGIARVPEFSFNPVKWSDAYDLQKRTGYVFCPREVAPIIGLASKIVFLAKFGAVMAEDADGYIKASATDPAWLSALVTNGVIDEPVRERLDNQRFSLIRVRVEDLKVPSAWLGEDPDFSHKMVVAINKHLKGGLTHDHLTALGRVLHALYAFTDTWYAGPRISADLANERALQTILAEALRLHGLRVDEGSEVNGGELDLFVERAIIVENKFGKAASASAQAFSAAGMQGRRYAIALGSQVVIVVGLKALPSGAPSKTKVVEVRQISAADVNRVEIRFTLPFGAPVPSREKVPPPAAGQGFA